MRGSITNSLLKAMVGEWRERKLLWVEYSKNVAARELLIQGKRAPYGFWLRVKSGD